ncbi:amidohydrolase family protein [Neorhizobium alkalisoli]|uniref:Cytosine deaminase n=1 Tax=Neorhizobium alkalisoli TaxID=528178 RepID=A0A561R6S5_9HYPH|nr:amidohydrolase family protein [Neorhizobium alkalisoli]TWF58306.1 cytosine deaminase [Neorhizobium alkalisoli]
MEDHNFDLIIRNVVVDPKWGPTDIAIREGRIAGLSPSLRCEAIEEVDGEGLFAIAGFVDTHIHLDKACILDRCSICEGTLTEAVRETSRAKAAFEEADVYRRAASVVEKAIIHGTNRMRTFVEVDPRAGLRSFEAIKRIRADYAFALDIEICAFAQEGLTGEPETADLLRHALENGADLIGGCPYTDRDPRAHVSQIFDLAEAFGVAVDFHLDFDLDPDHTNLPAVIEETLARNYQGRVSIGHVTNLSALSPTDLADIAKKLSAAGIALTVLPATDLFLNGRGHDRLVPRGVAPAHLLAERGVTASIATNNVLNPFTPYGDACLPRMANLYANVAQLSKPSDIDRVFDMVTGSAAKLMGLEHGLEVGAPADIVLVDAGSGEQVIREIGRAVRGWKHGIKTFENGRPQLIRKG